MASKAITLIVLLVALGAIVTQVHSVPTPNLADEMGERGKALDKKVLELDKMIVKNWDELIGPLSPEDKAAFRRQYPAEAAEYDEITKHNGWPRTF